MNKVRYIISVYLLAAFVIVFLLYTAVTASRKYSRLQSLSALLGVDNKKTGHFSMEIYDTASLYGNINQSLQPYIGSLCFPKYYMHNDSCFNSERLLKMTYNSLKLLRVSVEEATYCNDSLLIANFSIHNFGSTKISLVFVNSGGSYKLMRVENLTDYLLKLNEVFCFYATPNNQPKDENKNDELVIQ